MIEHENARNNEHRAMFLRVERHFRPLREVFAGARPSALVGVYPVSYPSKCGANRLTFDRLTDISLRSCPPTTVLVISRSNRDRFGRSQVRH